MEIFYFKKAEELDNFIKEVSNLNTENNSHDAVRSDIYGAEFLQSWAWGEILKNEGKQVLRIGVRNKSGRILSAMTLMRKKIFGSYSYYYAPRGPIMYKQSLSFKAEVFNFLVPEIKNNYPRVLFLRIEPQAGDLFLDNNFRKNKIKLKKTIDQQPAETLILDLEFGREKLLANLHQKTRYNLGLAQKKGVEIKIASLADLSEFWRLLNLTGTRDNFRLHTLKHYENLMQSGGKFIRLFLANYQGRNIAAGLFAFYGDKVTYLHGASDYKYRQVMAPYLLQWSVIEIALSANYKYYDFYGIDEQKWPGVTRFKLGFGGQRVKYAGTYDLIFSPGCYKIYNFFRKLRRGKF